MSRTRKITFAAAALLLIGLTTGKLLNQAKGDVAQNAYSSVIPVSGYVLELKPFVRTIEEAGTVQGQREAILSAETGGQIERIYVEVGDIVKAGAPLLKLDDAILGIEADRASIAYDKAQLDFGRIEKLYNESSISESDFEGAKLNLKAAEVQYRFARKSHEDATIRAPFGGTISAKLTEVGQMIDRGQPAFQIVDMETLKLKVAVPESDVSRVLPGATATVFVEALNDSIPAIVSTVGSRAMQGARTFPVELTFEAVDGLKSGMFARAFIFAGVDSSSILVPRAATLPDVGRTIVYVAKGNKAAKKIVKSTGMSGDQIAVQGIAEGDTLIVTGNQLLSQGTEIALTLNAESAR